ncbi:MAG: leucine-rich repeat domain-containing protein [Eubacterium sp.]|nr:leucine-rich repeat domain-containing protein [Eubacterium sp.]
MKKIAVVMFLLLLGGITAVPCEAKVHRGKTKDGVTYQYNTKTKTLTMSGKRIKGSYPENYSIKTHGYVKDKPWQKWSWKARKIVLKEGVESVTDSAFTDFERVKKIVFPKTIKKIGNQAFIDTGIKKLELPDSVIEIGRGAFERQMVSKGIKKIRLPKKLRNIGTAAFARNDFTSITIPQDVEFIGARAFDECSELKTVYIKSKKIKKIGKDIFRNIFDGVTVYVPKSKVKRYRKMFSRSMYANVKAMK